MSDLRKKLSKTQRQEILTKYESGDHTQAELASEYGVASNTISRIVQAARQAELMAMLRNQRK